jgi:parallel beta-helix repeat protein
VVEGNTCARNGGYGLFLTNNFETIVRGNILYGNARAQLQLSGRASYERTGREHNIPQNHTITANVLCATGEEQSTLLFRPEQDYGALLGNRFIHTHRAEPISVRGRGSSKWSKGPVSIAEWQEQFPWADPAPVFIGPDLVPDEGKPVRLLTNGSRMVSTLPAPGLWIDPDMKLVRDEVTLAPHASTVLVRLRPTRLAPAERSAPPAGRLSWFHVIVEQDEEWSAQSSADWLVVPGEGNGTGPGTVRYKVLPNEAAAGREGVISAAGQEHVVRQTGTDTE